MDFRWHAFTLVAVFLALGVGFTIGIVAPQDRVLLQQQEDLIARLERDFGRLRDENRRLAELSTQLQERLKEQETMLEALGGMAVAGRLHDRTVLLIQLGPLPQTLRDQVESLLHQAGARVVWNDWDPLSGRSLSAGDGGSPAPPRGTWRTDGVAADAVVLLQGEPVSSDAWESLGQRLRDFAAGGIPVVAAGAGMTPGEMTRLGRSVQVTTVGDLTHWTNRVQLVLSLLSPAGTAGNGSLGGP